MTPIRRPANQQEEAYNRCHQLARHRVERCIGLLKSRFRCLSRQRVLMYSPAKAGAIINSFVVLHNIMVEQKYPETLEDGDLDDEEVAEDDGEQRGDNVREQGSTTRERLIRIFFKAIKTNSYSISYVFVSSSIVIDIIFFIAISETATLLKDVAISANIVYFSSDILKSLSSEEGTDATSTRRRLL